MNTATLVLIAIILSTAMNPQTTGVKPGTQSTYILHSFRADAFQNEPLKTTPIDTTYRVEVQDVRGSNITFSFHSLNATYFLQPDGEQLTADITTPYVSGSPVGYVHLFFFPSGLQQGSAVVRATYFDGWNMTVTDVRKMQVLGIEREVCHIAVAKNATSLGDLPGGQVMREELFIDRETGLLVSWVFEFSYARYQDDGSVSFSRFAYQSWELSGTNAWSIPIWMRWDYLIFVSLLLLAITLILSMRLFTLKRKSA